MELANPSLNPPALQPTLVKRFSNHSRGHSRSPSHSPVRPYSALSFDPLLRSLSPSATLYAFSRAHPSFENSRSPSPRRRELKTSVAKVSDDQRELGTRAAQACLDIRGWTRELASWQWPGCFDEPEPARKKARISMMSIGSSASATTNGTGDHDVEDRWFGSLPANTVEEFDKRCQEVATGLDDIEMDELKDFALKAHHNEGQSIAERLDSNDPDRKDLDDFTAVVTATVLQTLPYLSELNRLLDTWTIRIAILKQIPGFLADMDRLRRDLDHGWAAIAVSLRKTGGNASLESRNMDEMQGLIDARMTALGSTLDGFLDMLEGQEDTVPDIFLDKFEELEQRYAEWVVTAQQRVLGDELKTFEPESSPISPTAILLNTEGLDRSKTPTLRDFDRARTPTILDTDGVRSPVLHEFERAKTPVIHEIDRAKTPIMDSFVAPIRDATAESDDEADLEPDRDDLVRETRKSLLLRLSQDAGNLPRLVDGTNEGSNKESTDNTRAVVEPTPRELVSTQATPPSKPEPHNASVRSTASTDSDLRGSPNGSSIRPSADTILPAHDSTPTVKSRKGSILGRLFKRNKSSELKREASVTSEPAERTGRPESSSSFVRAARRSFSRKRTSKRETEPVWGGRTPSPDTKHRISNGDVAEHRHSRRSLQVERPSTMQHTTRGAESEDVQRPATASAHSHGLRPLTYQPKGLQQRPISMTQPQFPDNWPLPENAQGGATAEMVGIDFEEAAADDVEDINLRTVRSMGAMNSDNFLDVFIGGFPATPTTTSASKTKQADIAWARLNEGEQAAAARHSEDKDGSVRTGTPNEPDSRIPVPVVTSSMLSSDGRQDDLSVARAISIDGLRKFDHYSDKEVNVKYMIDKRDTSLPIAVATDLADPQSEIQRSTKAGQQSDLQALPQLPGQQQAETVPIVKEELASPLPPQEMSAEPAHKVLLAVDTSAQHSRQISADATDDESGTDYKNLLKRASTASIKAHAASELRSIDVPARKRDSSKLALSQPSSEVPSPTVQSPVTQIAQADSTPNSRRSSITQFNRPGYSRSNSRNGAQSPAGSMDTPNFSRLRSSSVDTDDNRATPLSITVAKRRLREAPGLSTISPSAEYTEPPTSAPENKPVKSSTRVAPADNFDRHVSEVLESLPAPIRFRNRAGDDIYSAQTSSPARAAAKSLRPRSTLAHRQSSGTGLTLAPAEANPRRAAPSDPEIKLYHLTQTGRDEPIKLFVRLVGEGERVMVRVGGGWSDLADFLRQYAEHHGSRTVSGSINGLELQTAGNSPAGSRRTSGAVPTLADRRGRPTSREGETTSTLAPVTHPVTSPVSVIEGIVELPGSEPHSAVTPTSPVGGKLRKLDRKKSRDALSDQKARWVTRMLEKAKRETAPSKNNKDGSFGSMGRIGSTKRVFFSSPGSKSEQNGAKKR